MTKVKHALWLVDRAFIDSKYWNNKKKKLKVTMITCMKTSLVYQVEQERDVCENEINKGVFSDQIITLESSDEPWRLIIYRTPRNSRVEFLTNDFELYQV